jgi:hypothetical protein
MAVSQPRPLEHLTSEQGVLLKPSVRFHDLERIRRCDEHLAENRVGVQRQQRHQAVQLCGRKHAGAMLEGHRE